MASRVANVNAIELVFDYVNSIVGNKVIACKKVVFSCERFLHDYKRDDLVFDESALDKFVRWASMFKHSKGELAGKAIDFSPFQLFIIANIFCFRYKRNGYRRYKKAYIQLARKNAKSQLLSLIATYEAFTSRDKGEVYIAATDREQAKIVYNEALTQLNGNRELGKLYTDSYGRITVKSNGSIIMALSRDSKKTGDGTSPSLAIIDRYLSI